MNSLNLFNSAPRTIGISLVILIFLTACTVTEEIDSVVTEPPLIEPLPVTVALYYTETFRNHQSRSQHRAIDLRLPTGAASAAWLSEVSDQLFLRKITIKDEIELTDVELCISGIIEPAIDSVSLSIIEQDMFTFVGTAVITYRFTLYSAARNKLASWRIKGTATVKGGVKPYWQRGSEAMRLAMRDAAAQFLLGFSRQPGVDAWLRNLGVKGNV